ncbi:MAG: hypothetical protein LBP67_05000 [Bacteroidales bacterium]|jgi:hypothetical protein|nr:hypothetical protein [Bacteroidales bacterium]
MNLKYKTPILENPQLIDRAVGEIQTGLKSSLNWLDYAFGKAQRITKVYPNGKRLLLPTVYAGGKDYLEVSPNDNIGNFCWFDFLDPQVYQQDNMYVENTITCQCGIVFWFDFRRLKLENERDIENVKQQILKILNGRLMYSFGSLMVNKIYERSENIYKGYTLDEANNQFLMHPFGGLRFECSLNINETCYENFE